VHVYEALLRALQLFFYWAHENAVPLTNRDRIKCNTIYDVCEITLHRACLQHVKRGK
jgi:hypothetical protein